MDITRSLPPGSADGAIVARRTYEPAIPTFNSYAPPPPSDWQRYLVAIGRHKMLVAVVTIVGTLTGVIATRFLDREYSARAILWIERAGGDEHRGIISAEAVVDAPGWVQLVTSNAVLDSVVAQRQLFLAMRDSADAELLASLQVREDVRPGDYRLAVGAGGADYELTTADGAVLERGRVGDSIGTTAGFAWLPDSSQLHGGQQATFTLSAPSERTVELARRLKVKIDAGGSFLVLQLRGTNPAVTAATVNAIAERAVDVAAEMKRTKFQELALILGEQYEHARSTLDTAESRLRNFRVRTIGVLGYRSPVPVPRAPAIDLGLAAQPLTLRGELDQTRRDRAAIDAALRLPAGSGARIDALAVVPSVQQSPRLVLALQEVTRKQAELRQLLTRLTDESAPVVALRAEVDSLEGRAIPDLARVLVAQLSSQEVVARPRVDSAFGTARRLPALELDESRLLRDVASAEELANEVRQRFEAARLALVSSLPDVRVLDAAVMARRPLASLAPLVIALALLSSFGLAVAGIVVRDGVDPKVRYPEQVTRGMHLPILGAMPRVAMSADTEDETAPAVEALRALRMRVLHAQHGGGPLLLTITSPSMGEGKSFLASNLALSFADAGYRTLLIDGDVRRGALHVVLETPQRPGFTDLLAGRTTLAEAVRATTHAGLSFIPSGTRMHRAPELLLSPRMQDTIDLLRTSYDVVLVDSPPLAAGADPVILGAVTRNLLMVLRSGSSDLQHAAAKMEVLDALPIRIIGAVLNDVRDGGAFRHYTYDPTDYDEAVGGKATTGQERPRILQGVTHD